MWKIGICVLVPLLILINPAPSGLSTTGWQLFAMYIAAILGLIFRPFSEGVIFMMIIGISGLAFGNMQSLLSGYAYPMVWLVVTAFMIGTAFVVTGLGRRIAYLLIKLVGSTPLRLGYVACLTDLVISPATPSNAARTGGIVYPIFQNIAGALDSNPGPTSQKIGAYLTFTTYYASFITSCIFLTAMAPNILILSLGQSILKFNLDWIGWTIAAVVPCLITLFIIPLVVYKLCPPAIKKIDNKNLADKGLSELGPMSKREKILCILFVCAILGWAIGSVFKIDATAVAITFVGSCLAFRVMTWENILATKGAWNTFIWYGGIVGLANGLSKAKFFDWLAKVVDANLNLTGVNTFVIFLALVLFSIVVRYLFASGAAFVTTLLPILFTVGLVANVPVLPLFFLLAFAADYSGMLTHYTGTLSPILFGAGYVEQATWWKVSALMCLIFMTIIFVVGLPYWKVLGLW